MFRAGEIAGLDPANPTRQFEIRESLWRHGVVCLRFDRPLGHAEFRSVAAMFGAVKDPIGYTREGNALRYSEERQVIDAGFVVAKEMHEARRAGSAGGNALRPGLFEFFHTDDSYVAQPAAATVLHARALPSSGGDTNFMDMRQAYRLLDPAMQARLIGLHAVHAYNNCDAFPPRASASGPLEQLAAVSHPIVRAHPVSGEPALYFDLDRATHVREMPEREGRALLRALQDHAERNAPRYDHQWHPHDVLAWDNALVQHRASGDFPVGEPRRFWRHLISGTQPAGFVS